MVDEFQMPKYQVDIEEARGIAIGDGSMIIHQVQEEWLIEESLTDVQADSFVPPSHDQSLLQTLQIQHLLVLCGANRMGKAALSRYIASCLEEEQPSLNTYRMRRRGDVQDLVDNLSLEEHLIVLVYDADPLEIEDILQTVHEMALETDNFVILTTDTSPESFQVSPECEPCIAQVNMGFPYTKHDLQLLLVNRMNDLLPALQGHGLSPQALAHELGSPSQIVRLAGMLQMQPELPDADELQNMIGTLQNVDLEVNRWVRGLDKNERYLALTLALLDDLPEKRFWALYEEMVQIWQKRDFTLLPLDYYALENFRDFVDLESRIAFQEADYRNALLDALLGQYRRSLVATLPFLENTAKRDAGSDRVSRIAIAQAVGEIGTVEWSEVEDILLSWATHRSARVRASTSHAFREVLDFSGIDSLEKILDRLDLWVTMHTPENREDDIPAKYNIRWTVASSLGRIGRVVPRQIFRDEISPRLHKLSWDENFHVRRSVVYALRSLALIRFADVQEMLNERAADWHYQVRSEVVAVLYKLSDTRWSEVYSLLSSWLQGEGQERHWTALWIILRLGDERPILVEDLYEFANQDQGLRTNLYRAIIDILEQETIDEQSLSKLGVLVRDDASNDSFLIVQPMIQALDYHLPNANRLIESWQSDPRPKLQQAARVILGKLETIHTERRRRWQVLLKHYLDDDEELEAFASTLPPHEREAFWRNVRASRREKERELARERREREEAAAQKRRNTVTLVVAISVILCCLLPVVNQLWSMIQSLFK